MFKAILLGDAAVGKTSVRRRYLGKSFISSHIATIGVDFAQKLVKVDDQFLPALAVACDTGREKKFASLGSELPRQPGFVYLDLESLSGHLTTSLSVISSAGSRSLDLLSSSLALAYLRGHGHDQKTYRNGNTLSELATQS